MAIFMLASLLFARFEVIEPLIEAIVDSNGYTNGHVDRDDVDVLQLGAVIVGLWAVEVMVLLGRHFPHRQVLKRLTLSTLLAAAIVLAVNPHGSASATPATMSVQERARLAVLDGAASLGVPTYAGWSLVAAGVLVSLAQVHLIPLRHLAAPAHLFYGLILGATFGAYGAGVLIPTAPPALAALWSLQWACLGGLIFVAGLVSPTAASSNTAIVLGGPLYTASLCAALASHAVSELATPPEYIPHGVAAAKAYYSTIRLQLALFTTVGHAATSLALAVTSSRAASIAATAGVGASRSVALGGLRFGRDARTVGTIRGRQGMVEWVVVVGNMATVVAFVVASTFTYMRLAGPNGSASSSTSFIGLTGNKAFDFKRLILSSPLGLGLLLLKDDGGLLIGLNQSNQYAPSIFTIQLRLVLTSIYHLLYAGAPFVEMVALLGGGNDEVGSAAAAAAAAAAAEVRLSGFGSGSTLPAALLDLDLSAANEAKAWRELSFWTAGSLVTPSLELLLLLATLPTHFMAMRFLWSRRNQRNTSTMVMFCLPLNFVAITLSQLVSTQLMGFVGFVAGAWQIHAMQVQHADSQRRI